MKSMLPCPLCLQKFSRRQDRDRHLPSHLPYWIGCSRNDCSWRGYRIDAFRKHWYCEHQSTPDEEGSKLYDPRPLTRKLVKNPTSIGDAEIQAISWVMGKAMTLCKQEFFADPWGHKRNSKGFRQHPRSSETDALPITLPTPFSSLPPTQPLCVSAPVVPRDPHIEAKHGPYATGSPLVYSCSEPFD